MTRLARTLSAAAAVAALGLASAPVLSAGPSPLGSWQLSSGESRYVVSECGDGQLCAKLVWLRDDARTPANLQYLNQWVVQGARQVEANKWQGTVTYDGERIGGHITMTGDNTIRLTGCKVIACQSFVLNRI